MSALFPRALALLLALAWFDASAQTADRPIEDFYGEYVGQTVAEGELDARDITVNIQPLKDKGFSVAWTTVVSRADGSTSKKSYTINFQASQRDSIYAAGMRPNLFGGWVPLDPMKGEPYIWARVRGNSLTVYAMHVRDDGGYEMQTYERTLTEDGMVLEFRRVADGIAMKTIEGYLKRVK